MAKFALLVLAQCCLVQVLKAVTEIVHDVFRICLYSFVDGNAKLNGARITENAHADANAAALGNPEHGLYQFAASKVNRVLGAWYVGEYGGRLVAQQIQSAPFQNIRAAAKQVQQAVGYLGLVRAFRSEERRVGKACRARGW